MTGLERNADVVRLSAYAPLLAHIDAWRWTPNLIWFDNLRAFGTPSYRVQQLFGAHRGARVLPLTMEGSPANGTRGVFASAAMADDGTTVILKLVNPSSTAMPVSLSVGTTATSAETWVLTGPPDAENTFAQPDRVRPSHESVTVTGGRLERTLPASSFSVIRVARR